MNRYSTFLRGFLIVTTGLLLGLLGLFFSDRNQVPAKAQAEELFRLYFEMDHVRQESAQIFAELIEVDRNPERVGAVDAIGSKPPLASHEELTQRLKENQSSVKNTLAVIDANRFTDPEVDLRYEEVRTFYTALSKYEDLVLTELSRVKNNQEQRAHLGTTLFEGADWPALLAEDAHLRDTLASLAALHSLEFAPTSYEDLFRQRLIELDTPFVSDEVNTIVIPFNVNELAQRQVVLVVSFEIPLSDKIKISLEGPHGRIITEDQLAEDSLSSERNQLSYITRDQSTILIKLFPADSLVMPIMGDWKLYVTAPVGSNVVFGVTQG